MVAVIVVVVVVVAVRLVVVMVLVMLVVVAAVETAVLMWCMTVMYETLQGSIFRIGGKGGGDSPDKFHSAELPF